jgi:addiction module HigA family antidote
MREIANILGAGDTKKLRRFQASLTDISIKYRKHISETPLNMRGAPMSTSLTRRREWLDRKVIDPCNLLIAALGKDNRPMFSTWPDATPPRSVIRHFKSGIEYRLHGAILRYCALRAVIRNLHMAKKLPPIHPGEILREEFLVPLKLTPYAVAAALHVPRTPIERIAREEKPVTADTALRLGKFFKTGAAFWMNMQARFDLETAEDVLAPEIKKIASFEAA